MADIVETIQNQNHEKELSLTFALFLLLLFIVILCSKGDNKLVQKGSVPAKITDYFPPFVPIRLLTYADIFILDDAGGIEEIKEQRLNG